MLVLSRKEGERLVIGENVIITVNRISGNRITLGIEAPRDVRIVRGELEPKGPAPQQAKPSRESTDQPPSNQRSTQMAFIELDAAQLESMVG